ncbi:SLATT domain-containing protein [Actinoallomurus sp. NPDC052308]|uniref:SLATT domain-containing protein n=1 Tax=Actinoallomurus sp. NPDC052308 TaxID=3155530 RepID=UPI0034433735
MIDNELFGGTEPAWRVTVAAELYRIEEHCSHSARAQAETVKIWRVLNLWLGSTAVLAAGVAGSLVLAGDRFPLIAGGLALGAALLATVVSMVAPGRKENQAAEAAKAYRSVETAARQSREVDLPGHAFMQARQVLDELTGRWHAVIRNAPPAPAWAQHRAERNRYVERAEEVMTERMSDIVRVFQTPRRAADQPA